MDSLTDDTSFTPFKSLKVIGIAEKDTNSNSSQNQSYAAPVIDCVMKVVDKCTKAPLKLKNEPGFTQSLHSNSSLLQPLYNVTCHNNLFKSTILVNHEHFSNINSFHDLIDSLLIKHGAVKSGHEQFSRSFAVAEDFEELKSLEYFEFVAENKFFMKDSRAFQWICRKFEDDPETKLILELEVFKTSLIRKIYSAKYSRNFFNNFENMFIGSRIPKISIRDPEEKQEDEPLTKEQQYKLIIDQWRDHRKALVLPPSFLEKWLEYCLEHNTPPTEPPHDLARSIYLECEAKRKAKLASQSDDEMDKALITASKSTKKIEKCASKPFESDFVNIKVPVRMASQVTRFMLDYVISHPSDFEDESTLTEVSSEVSE